MTGKFNRSFAPLGAALNRVVVGEPLPLDIYDKQQVLLLAHGNTVESARQLQLLVDRGGLVLFEEISDPLQAALHAPRARLPEIWSKTVDRVVDVLASTAQPAFESRLQDVLPVMQTLVDRDPDLAIFQLIWRGGGERTALGARNAMFAASLAMLLGTRLGWSGERVEVAAKCALTMNLSILQLLGELNAPEAVVGPAERRAIDAHPLRSREILEDAGIRDADWLRAVEQHHERPDGSGYPRGLVEVCGTGQLVQCVDGFVEGLGRATRRGDTTATGVLRQMYLNEPKSTLVAALIKELGVYPPGTAVRLKNGEIGIVVQRGPTTTTPVVALHDGSTSAAQAPVVRHTTESGCSVVSVLPSRALPLRGRAVAESVWSRLPLSA